MPKVCVGLQEAPPLPPTLPSQDLDPGKPGSMEIEEISDSEGLYGDAGASRAEQATAQSIQRHAAGNTLIVHIYSWCASTASSLPLLHCAPGVESFWRISCYCGV